MLTISYTIGNRDYTAGNQGIGSSPSGVRSTRRGFPGSDQVPGELVRWGRIYYGDKKQDSGRGNHIVNQNPV